MTSTTSTKSFHLNRLHLPSSCCSRGTRNQHHSRYQRPPDQDTEERVPSLTPNPGTSGSLMKIMPHSTLSYILIKYAIFLNWTLTGFWIMYNTSDYSKNAQIISEKIASFSDSISKESVVWCLICYTITLSCITFFGLVGVCYENFCLTLSLAVGYLIYILFDIVSNIMIGVPVNLFFICLQIMLSITCLNLFFFALMIRFHEVSFPTEPETRVYYERANLREQTVTSRPMTAPAAPATATTANLESIHFR